MKRIGLVALVLVLAAASPAAAQEEKFTLEQFQIGYLATLVPPDVKTNGGGEIAHVVVRNEVQVWGPAPEPVAPPDAERIDPLLPSTATSTRAYRGPCWGTFEWTIVGVGSWVGTWTAPVMDLVTYESKVSMVGHGVGGEIDGKQLKFDAASAPCDWYVTGTIRIH